MQNFNAPQQPQQPYGGFGAPPPPQQPPPKKGMSTGAKVLVAVAAVFALGAVLVVALGVGGYFYLRNRAREIVVSSGEPPRAGFAGATTPLSSTGAEAGPPSPTAEQQAAVAGGQSAEWAQQEIAFTVPQRWKKNTADSNSFMWSSPGSSDAAFLIVNISPMGADFPADVSIEAFYNQAVERNARGEVNELKWLKLGGVRGVMFRESAPERADSPQRLQWLGYRTYKGQVQLVNVMLTSQGKHFARHEDALYGILYSAQLSD